MDYGQELYTHKGYICYHEEEPGYDRDDYPKHYHSVKTPNGETISPDHTHRGKMSEDFFTLWVDLGCPSRDRNRSGNRNVSVPWDLERLRKYQQFLLDLLQDISKEAESWSQENLSDSLDGLLTKYVKIEKIDEKEKEYLLNELKK